MIFYIGDLVILLMLERKTSSYIYLDLDFIVYDSTTINNMKLYYILGFDIRRETTLGFPIALFYLLAFASVLHALSCDICLFLLTPHVLSFLLFLHPV